MNCGNYRGRQVIDIAAKIAKKEAKMKARREAQGKTEEEARDEDTKPQNLDAASLSKK